MAGIVRRTLLFVLALMVALLLRDAACYAVWADECGVSGVPFWRGWVGGMSAAMLSALFPIVRAKE
jgi:hypothetical protein